MVQLSQNVVTSQLPEVEDEVAMQKEIFACCQFAVSLQNVTVFENLCREIKGNEEYRCRLLYQAIDIGCIDIIQICLRHGMPTDDCRKMLEFEAPLLYAIDIGNLDVVKYLCSEQKINVRVTNKYGMTAVMIAAKRENCACLEILMKHGCDVTTRDHLGNTALHHLSYPLSRTHKALPCLKLLVKAGCDVNAQNSHGDTICHVAEVRQHYQLVEALVSENCAINSSDFRLIPCLSNLCTGQAFSVVRRGSMYYYDGNTWCYREPRVDTTKHHSVAFKTLKDACRFEIRKHLGLNIFDKLEKLCLPTVIKDYILLKDVLSEDSFIKS
ncbi:hypothetical protein LOTGIDRAFT_159286 [Lottia gigantea]|uniref:SOCS box domain-containing protein n=1 Tax=Lottia gigantea TaxID=225164 RepID=V4A0C3_LOTGI|nr:hypothetical protein LOTGIDRAFT_159286 [Lottia gigantea]ESO97263.1 hypothetical protein LOTGIDRAFT_159286 [Lottia gigantea]